MRGGAGEEETAEARPFSWIDHLIRPQQQRRRDRQAERLGGLEVDDEFEFRWLLYRKISRLLALENFGHVLAGSPVYVGNVSPVSHQATRFGEFPVHRHGWQTVLHRKIGDTASVEIEEGARLKQKSSHSTTGDCGDSFIEIVGSVRFDKLKIQI